MGNLIDAEARRMASDAFQAATRVLQENREKLSKLAEELIIKETMSHEDVQQILGPSPWGKKSTIEAIKWDFLYDDQSPISVNRDDPTAKGDNSSE